MFSNTTAGSIVVSKLEVSVPTEVKKAHMTKIRKHSSERFSALLRPVVCRERNTVREVLNTLLSLIKRDPVLTYSLVFKDPPLEASCDAS